MVASSILIHCFEFGGFVLGSSFVVSFLVSLLVLHSSEEERAGPDIIILFSCSTQLSTKFQQPTKTKILKQKNNFAFKLSYVVFIMLINVKMPTKVAF